MPDIMFDSHSSVRQVWLGQDRLNIYKNIFQITRYYVWQPQLYMVGQIRQKIPPGLFPQKMIPYSAGKLSIVSNNLNFVGVHDMEAFHRFKQPKFRWGTRRGSFPSFQTTKISLGYTKRKLSIVSNKRNFVGVHEEKAFHRFKQTKFRWGTRRGSFLSFQTRHQTRHI